MIKNALLVAPLLFVASCYGNTVQLRGRIRQDQRSSDSDWAAPRPPLKEKPKAHECEIGPADKCRDKNLTCQYDVTGTRKCLPAYC